MSQNLLHRIHICSTCREPVFRTKGRRGKASQREDTSPGLRLAERLRQDVAETDIGAMFDISEIACMAGCDRPCTVAFQADNKATYLFGDIDPDGDLDALIEFAKQYASLKDGWCSATERPKALINKTLARVPAIGSGLVAGQRGRS